MIDKIRTKISNAWRKVTEFVSSRWKAAVKTIITAVINIGILVGLLASPVGDVVIDATPQATTWFDDISASGDLSVSGHGALGGIVGPADHVVLYIFENPTDTNAYLFTTGADITNYFSPSSDAATMSVFGFRSSAQQWTSYEINDLVTNEVATLVKGAATIDQVAGSRLESRVQNSVAATIDDFNLLGHDLFDLEDAVVTKAAAIDIKLADIDTGSVVDSYGVYIAGSTIGAGSAGDQTGLYIEDITGATGNDYSIYTAGGTHYLGDDVTVVGLLNVEETTVTIDLAGAVTVASSNVTVDTNGGAANDNLDTINGGASGDTLIVRAANDARTVVARDGIDNLQLAGDCTLDDTDDTLMLIYDGSNWLQLACNDNS